MAKLTQYPPKDIRLRLRGRLHYSTWMGQLTAKKWPRKRPGPGTPAQQQARADFKRLVAAQKDIASFDRDGADRIATDSLYTWRDVISRAMVGRLVIFEYFEMEPLQVDDIQLLLNQIGSTQGGLITNFGSLWGIIIPGTANQFLAIDPITGIPGWFDFPATGITEITGDAAAGPGSGSQVLTLADTGVTPGIYDLATIQVDSKGRIIDAMGNTVSGGIDELTGDGTAGPGSGSQALTLAATGVVAGTYSFATITVDAKGRATSVATGSPPAYINQLTGDAAAGPGSGSVTLTLTGTGITPGTYTAPTITIDAKGRAIAASSNSFVPAAAAAHPGLVASRWYSSPSSTATSNVTMTANQLYARPIYIPATTTIIQIGISVTSGVVGSNAELGLYTNNNGMPDQLIADFGQVSTNGIAVRTITGLTQVLAPGWYWIVVGFSHTPAVRSFQAGETALGWLMGWTAINATNPLTGIIGAWTYSANNLPSTFPTPSILATASPVVMLGA